MSAPPPHPLLVRDNPATRGSDAGDTDWAAHPPPIVGAGRSVTTSTAWAEGDWEERSADTALWQHIVAGGMAGMAEHAVMYPLDCIKTHVQVAHKEAAAAGTGAGAPTAGAVEVARDMVARRGVLSLWRGIGVTLGAVVPAHAMMFAAYEGILDAGGAHSTQHADASPTRVALVGFLAGGVSTLFHDATMVPAETIKQRLQLGYYRDAGHALKRMAATGGGSLFRALPTTLATNVPYASLMMMSNESLRRLLNPTGAFSLPTFLTAGAVSGALAAAATTPLDVVKTRLQTQGLGRAHASTGELHGAPQGFKVRYRGFADAARAVYESGGVHGFFRGMGPRMLQTGPSCALSWCAYESAKRALQEYN